ncbi:hypothetical protein MWN34_00385 [Ancylobacter sp. 6x-1]|uniref:Uncharacterized protein n=1 Tax=Ancylobacter crimeensis TaxID=2579147 RepID=A0ABT0D5Y2_9HYPH|nr:hypothetical protein [Ancylobacter crimeensis]MCK0195361.1 hypothetical protein [Ancylobacter crimeensis]
MSGYLERLVAQARGATPELRPRPRFRFEAEDRGEGGFGEIEAENEVSPSPPSPAMQPMARSSASLPMENATEPAPQRAPQPTPVTPPAPDLEHPVERIVQVERRETTTEHVVERHLHRIERMEVPTVRERPARAEAQPDAPPSPPPPRQTGKPRPDDHTFDALETAPQPSPPAGRETPHEDAPWPPRFVVEPRRASAPTEQYTISTPAEAAPEITISIGVLDIRLTRPEPVAPIRPALEQRREHAAPPLADYLARRSGGGS